MVSQWGLVLELKSHNTHFWSWWNLEFLLSAFLWHTSPVSSPGLDPESKLVFVRPCLSQFLVASCISVKAVKAVKTTYSALSAFPLAQTGSSVIRALFLLKFFRLSKGFGCFGVVRQKSGDSSVLSLALMSKISSLQEPQFSKEVWTGHRDQLSCIQAWLGSETCNAGFRLAREIFH